MKPRAIATYAVRWIKYQVSYEAARRAARTEVTPTTTNSTSATPDHSTQG